MPPGRAHTWPTSAVVMLYWLDRVCTFCSRGLPAQLLLTHCATDMYVNTSRAYTLSQVLSTDHTVHTVHTWLVFHDRGILAHRQWIGAGAFE
jgi:hypothetical protein